MNEQAPEFSVTEKRSLIQTVEWMQQPNTVLERSKLLTQIAIPDDIHSCFLTSALNGGIVTGILAPEEAAFVQDVLTSDAHKDKWSAREVGGRTVLAWHRDLNVELGRILRREFPFRYISPNWCDVSENTIQSFLSERLTQGYALSWGDETHQRLAVGTSVDGSGRFTEIVDPINPLKEEHETIATVAQWHRPSSPIAIIGNYVVLSEIEHIQR